MGLHQIVRSFDLHPKQLLQACESFVDLQIAMGQTQQGDQALLTLSAQDCGVSSSRPKVGSGSIASSDMQSDLGKLFYCLEVELMAKPLNLF